MNPRHTTPLTPGEMEETKEHILAAGRELLLAAHGALRFCLNYAGQAAPEGSRTHVVGFFEKAIAVADELGRGLVQSAPVTDAARKAAGPLMDAMEREMEQQAQRFRRNRTEGCPAKGPMRKKKRKKKQMKKKTMKRTSKQKRERR